MAVAAAMAAMSLVACGLAPSVGPGLRGRRSADHIYLP